MTQANQGPPSWSYYYRRAGDMLILAAPAVAASKVELKIPRGAGRAESRKRALQAATTRGQQKLLLL